MLMFCEKDLLIVRIDYDAGIDVLALTSDTIKKLL